MTLRTIVYWFDRVILSRSIIVSRLQGALKKCLSIEVIDAASQTIGAVLESRMKARLDAAAILYGCDRSRSDAQDTLGKSETYIATVIGY